ncbi:MAG TPA: hypothetical protein VKT82_13285 [Ktedonobacterales bacterium]|nr:hypothetical protein [Ktedonobacterales bacterium]
MAAVLKEDPGTSPNWRHHKNACPHYRERWFPENNLAAGEPIYQVFCMQNTPPVTSDEQDKCLHSRFVCWRLAGKAADRPPAEERSQSAPKMKVRVRTS